jgi:glycosyltransferase involved in cell wall biosynthesis
MTCWRQDAQEPTGAGSEGGTQRQGGAVTIQFLHAVPTPHNNHLLDAVAAVPGVQLHRHYLLGPREVPGRPWKGMGAGSVQVEHIHTGYDTRFDWRLVKLALADRRSAFFVIGWDYPVLVAVLLILGLRRRPLVMWDDGPSAESLASFRQFWWHPRQLLKRLLVALINRTPGTYFHTGVVTRDDILALGVKAAKMQSLPFFVKPGRRDAVLRSSYGCGDDTALILAGGRLTVEKGYDVYIEALGRLRQQATRPWRAVLIGSGPEQARLHALAHSLGLGDHLRFLAWAEPETFADHVHSCDIFAAPARFDHFPTTVIAAMQAGVAVVATQAVGSAVEFIETGLNGLLAPPDRPDALAAHLERLVQEPAYRQRLASAALETLALWPVERGAGLIVNAAQDAFKTCAG